jgi:hypothetical protein
VWCKPSPPESRPNKERQPCQCSMTCVRAVALTNDLHEPRIIAAEPVLPGAWIKEKLKKSKSLFARERFN